jgi:hypothetical protein
MKWLAYIGITLNVIPFLIFEYQVLMYNPLLLFDPITQFKVTWSCMLAPITWLGTALIIFSQIPFRRKSR